MGPRFGSSMQAFKIDNETSVSLIGDKYCTWIEEGRELEDPRVLWDYIKYNDSTRSDYLW